MKILITGASGICGSALIPLTGDKVLFDLKKPNYDIKENKFVKGDLNDIKMLEKSMKNCNVVIHCGGASNPDSSWKSVLKNNIMATQTLLEVATKLNIPKILFLSSNRVFEMYEIENAPMIYEPDFNLLLQKSSIVRPASHYGISKACCEIMGRSFSERCDIKFYVIRLGSVRCKEEDHPYAYAESGVKKGLWKRGSKQYLLQEKRLKSLWMSRRDFLQMVELCIEYEDGQFEILFGVSDNPRNWFDMEHTKKLLRYKPKDNAERFIQVPTK